MDIGVDPDVDGHRLRIALLIPSTGLIDGEMCDIAEERGAEALIFRVVPGAVADPRDPSAVADMVLEMGHPEQLAAGRRTDRGRGAGRHRVGVHLGLLPRGR